MKKPVLFIDTNCLKADQSFDRLFGNRQILESLSQEYEIYIPRVVMDELLAQKERSFNTAKNQIRHSCLRGFIPKEDMEAIDELTFDSIKDQMLENESIQFAVYNIDNFDNFFNRFYPLALLHKPPFEQSSDKGLKDALIAYSVEQFLEKSDEDIQVSVLTKDGRLCEYLSSNAAIRVYCDANELINSNESIKVNENVFPVKAIKPSQDKTPDEIESIVSGLVESRSFSHTHDFISQLSGLQNQLSNKSKVRLLKGAVDNDQIGWVLTDPDVKDFYLPIFKECQDALTDKEYGKFIDKIGLPNTRTYEDGYPRFSQCERDAYKAFSDAMFNHINSRDWSAEIRNDAEYIIRGLQKLLSAASLERSCLKWSSIIDLFICNGDIRIDDDCQAKYEIVDSFTDWFMTVDKTKHLAILQQMQSRFDMVDYYF